MSYYGKLILMNNKTILGIAFLLAGTLLTAATTAMAPAYAGGDGNKQKVEDESAGSIADCHWNEVEQSNFECIAASATEEGVIRDREPTLPPELEPETCLECFEEFLSLVEIGELVDELAEANQAGSIEQFCENVLEPGLISEREVRDFLTDAGFDEETQERLVFCLEDVGIKFEPDM